MDLRSAREGAVMFAKNEKHKQSLMFSGVELLPGKALKRLQSSWAQAFYSRAVLPDRRVGLRGIV